MILDSGDRTTFETGAVRDCQDGKGRCDLLPLDVIGNWYENKEVELFFVSVEKAKNENYDKNLRKALQKISELAYGGDFEGMIIDVAIHYEHGLGKYGKDNWKKGIPVSSFISSAVRHFLKYLRADNDERHDRATVWNLLGAMWTIVNKPELDDYTK